MMDFLDAVKAMKEGKQVRRPCMSECIYLIEENGYPRWKGLYNDEGSRDICIELFEAIDWEVVEEPKTLSDKWFKCYHINTEGKKQFYEADVKESMNELYKYLCKEMPLDSKFRSKLIEIFGRELIDNE